MPSLYLDIASGLSGDMLLGALLDLGVPPEHLEAELRKLNLTGYHLHIHRASRSGVEGVKFDVHLDHTHHHTHHHGHDHSHPHDHPTAEGHDLPHAIAHDHGHGHGHAHDHPSTDPEPPHVHGRSFAQIRDLIAASPLSDWVRHRSLGAFHRLAVAEGKIHGEPPDHVRFHEVGAVDSIIDFVGAAIALDHLGRPEVLAGPVVDGTGWVRCAHGRMPVPVPATLEILAARGIAITQCEEPHELVTPTGAALLAEFVTAFGPLAGFVPSRIGYGLGTRTLASRPNLVRALLGTAAPASPVTSEAETDIVAVLETNLDDLSPEILGHVAERAFALGALDVFHAPVHMKKHRPGTLLTLLAPPALAERLTELLLTETTAFGVRRTEAARRKLAREVITVATPFGPVRVKLGRLGARRVQASPEFESCRERAEQAGVPIQVVYEAARQATPPDRP